MNVNFEYAKTLAGVGSLLLLLSVIPNAGLILGIIGAILLIIGVKELANYFQDRGIYQSALSSVKFYIVALLMAAAAIAALAVGFGFATDFKFTAASFALTGGFGIGLAAFLGGIVIAFVLYIFAANRLRRMFNALAQESGEASFKTTANLVWWGALLTVVLVGLLLIFIAWIFATIGFFTMKSGPQQQANSTGNTTVKL